MIPPVTLDMGRPATWPVARHDAIFSANTLHIASWPEVESLFADDWQIARLERADILASEPRYVSRGLTAMHTSVFRLCRSIRQLTARC